MGKPESYISRIFGKDALKVRTFYGVNPHEGVFDASNDVVVLDQITFKGMDEARLLVVASHMVGHFAAPGPQTLPAYKMLEFAGRMGETGVSRVRNAKFSAIVRPDDVIEACREGSFFRMNRGNREVAQMQVFFSQLGVSAHQAGIFLEIAAQTIVENMAGKIGDKEQLYYPLILGFEDLMIFDQKPDIEYRVKPQVPGQLQEQNRFMAGADIFNRKDELVAAVRGMSFEFATAARANRYDRWNRR